MSSATGPSPDARSTTLRRVVTRRLTGAWAGLLVAAVALGACTADPGPTDEEIAASEADEDRFAACASLAADITGTIQDFVDQFAPATEQAGDGPDAQFPSVQDLQDAADRFAQRRAALGCGAREFQVLLGRAVEDLQGQGPWARAVVAQVRDQLLPPSGPPESVSVAPGDDLAAAVHDAGPGALVELAPGRHVLDEPLVLLRASRLVGAGSDRTTIVSEAADTVVLQAGGGPMVLEGVTVAHEGSEPASVLVVASGGYDLRDVEVRGGVADEAGGSGWGLVVGMRGREGVTGPQRITDLRVTGNAAGGMSVAADRAPVVAGLEAEDNGGCGLCFSAAAAGEFSQVRLRGNGVGALLAGDSAPTMTDVEASGNADAGVVAEEATSGTMQDVELTANGAAGAVLRGSSTVWLTGLTASDHAEMGVLVEGTAAPVLADVSVAGASVGVLVHDAATPEVDGVTVTDVSDAHMVWSADASGTVNDATCEAEAPGLVLLERSAPEVGGDVCAVVDQRDG